jgi:ABC-type glycerol-3-phosphate transport system substrate-binding protein
VSESNEADRAEDATATQPTRRRIVEGLRELWNRPVGEARMGRLTTAQRLLEGVAIGLVVALLAITLPAALDDPDDLEKGTVVLLSGHDDSIDGQRGKLIQQWNALHRDTQAQIVELPAIADAQRSEMLARAQAGGGGVDVYNLDVTWTAEFAAAGYLQSLDESRVRTGDFLPRPLSTCRYDGRLWALPFNTDVGLLYYNTELLAKVKRTEPPSDWGGLVDDAVVMAGISNHTTAGFVGQFADYEGLTVTALEMVWGAEGVVVDDEGAVLPDSRDVAAVRTAFGRLKTVTEKVPPTNEATSIEEFRNGRALYMRNWPVADRTLRDAELGPVIPFGVATLPGGSAALGGQNLAVSATTDMPKASRALVEFLTDARSQQQLFQRGGLPATRKIVYTDPAVQSDFTTTLVAALDGARTRPVVPHYAAFSRAFRAEVDAYVRGGQEVIDEDIRARLEAALQGREPPQPN